MAIYVPRGGLPGEKDRDARFLAKGYKSRILVLVRMFMTKRHYF